MASISRVFGSARMRTLSSLSEKHGNLTSLSGFSSSLSDLCVRHFSQSASSASSSSLSSSPSSRVKLPQRRSTDSPAAASNQAANNKASSSQTPTKASPPSPPPPPPSNAAQPANGKRPQLKPLRSSSSSSSTPRRAPSPPPSSSAAASVSAGAQGTSFMLPQLTSLTDGTVSSVVAAAKSGDIASKYRLAHWHLHGLYNCTYSEAKAKELIAEAAKAGHIGAIGMCHYLGVEGYLKDDRRAHSLFEEDAKNPKSYCGESMALLGELMMTGRVTPTELGNVTNEDVMKIIQDGLKWTVRACEASDAHAQYLLARFLLLEPAFDDRARKNAVPFMVRAAAHGHVEANWQLYELYKNENRTWISADLSKARDHLNALVVSKYPAALHEYGLALLGGLNGYRMNEKEGLNCIQQAAQLEHPAAVSYLAMCKIRGVFFAENVEEGRKMLEDAATKNNSQALYDLGLLEMEKGNAGDALQYFIRGAARRHAGCAIHVGNCYYHGVGVQEKNFDRALSFYLKALEFGDDSALLRIGLLLMKGADGVMKDLDKAYAAFQQLSLSQTVDKKTTAAAFHYMAQLHTQSDFSDQDLVKSAEFYQQAVKLGYGPSMAVLGRMYLNGHGVTTDVKKGVELIEKSAAQGSAAGMYTLGLMYSSGTGVKKDMKTALKYLVEAAKLGHSKALDIVQKFAARVHVPPEKLQYKPSPAPFQVDTDEGATTEMKDETSTASAVSAATSSDSKPASTAPSSSNP